MTAVSIARAPVVISVGSAMSAMPQIPDRLLHATNRREARNPEIAPPSSALKPAALMIEVEGGRAHGLLTAQA